MNKHAAVVAVHHTLNFLLETTSKHSGLYGQEKSCHSFRQLSCGIGVKNVYCFFAVNPCQSEAVAIVGN